MTIDEGDRKTFAPKAEGDAHADDAGANHDDVLAVLGGSTHCRSLLASLRRDAFPGIRTKSRGDTVDEGKTRTSALAGVELPRDDKRREQACSKRYRGPEKLLKINVLSPRALREV